MQKNKSVNNYLESLKEEILTFFSINQDQSFSLNQLHKHYDVKQRREKTLYGLLVDELVKDEKLYEMADGKISLNITKTALIGRLDHVNARFGFVRYDDSQPDVWISDDNLNGAIDGDMVKVSLFGSFYKKGANPEGKVIEIVERGRTEIVGKIQTFGNYALVKPDGKKIHDDIFIAKQHINEAKKNDKVIVRILEYGTSLKQITGEVIEILGKSGENNAEMHAIMAEFGLPVRFPEGVEEDAMAISEKITAEEIAKRRDFRNVLTFTIDPLDAQDFDDAISIQKLSNGNWEIGIHIADVTHYVRPGSALEAEAYRRATSVYLVDRCVPMLPEKLSNRLCSLRPHEEKLTFSAVFELTENAEIKSQWFGKTVIYSDKRFTYEEAQELLDQDVSETNPTESDFVCMLHLLNNLAKIIKKERFANGAISFETQEVKFQLDENGVPLGVYTKIRKDAHKLIEEFMLLANKKVAEFVHKKDPKNVMVYRVHDAPNPDKLMVFAKFANTLGYKLNVASGNISKSLNYFMDNLEGKPEQNVLESLAVRTMAKAIYTTDPRGHFGLAFEHYSHFTSPIRRYPDMMAHRLLEKYLSNDAVGEGVISSDACKHSSEREKMAAEAERASIKYKQVEFMSLQVKQVFAGVITGVTDFGIFVEMAGTACEGLVRMTDLKDDWYEFDQENYRVVGRKTGKIIQFGDALNVRVKGTDLEKRLIDLEIVGQTHSNNQELKVKKEKGERFKVGRRKKR